MSNSDVRLIRQYVGAIGPAHIPRNKADIEPVSNTRSHFLMISWIWAIFGIPVAYVLGVYCGPESQEFLKTVGSLGIIILPYAIYREHRLKQSK